MPSVLPSFSGLVDFSPSDYTPVTEDQYAAGPTYGPAGPAPDADWQTRATYLDSQLPPDPDLNRRQAVFDFLAAVDPPQQQKLYFIDQYKTQITKGMADEWLSSMDPKYDFGGNARPSMDQATNLALGAAVGFVTGGPVGAVIGGVGNVALGMATEGATDPNSGLPWLKDASPLVKETAGIAPAFLLPGKQFGGGLTLTQRALGIAGTVAGQELAQRTNLPGDEFWLPLLTGGAGLTGPDLLSRRSTANEHANITLGRDLPQYNDNAINHYVAEARAGHSPTWSIETPLTERPVDTLATRELATNAVNAVNTDGGRVFFDYDTRRGRLIVTDEGTGMTYDAMTHEYITPDDKPAKVTYLAAADGITTTSTARLQSGGTSTTELVTRDYGTAVNDRPKVVAHDDRPTGTTVDIKLRSDAPKSPESTIRWLQRFVGYSMLPAKIKLDATVDGAPVRPADTTPNFNEYTRFTTSDGSAELVIYVSDRATQTDNIQTHYLKDGAYQYTQGEGGYGGLSLGRELPAPSELIVDVRPLVDKSAPNYPFQRDRDSLSASVSPEFNVRVRGELVKLGIAAQDIVRKQVFDQAIQTQSGHIVIDPSQQFAPHYVAELASRPYVHDISSVIGTLSELWQGVVKATYSDANDAIFAGWDVHPKRRGAHYFSDRMGAAGTPDSIFFNLWSAMEVARRRAGDGASGRVIRENLATSLADVISHEFLHSSLRQDGPAFETALADLVSNNEALYDSTRAQLLQAFPDDLSAWLNDTTGYVEQVKRLGDPAKDALGGVAGRDGVAQSGTGTVDASVHSSLRASLEAGVQGDLGAVQEGLPGGSSTGSLGNPKPGSYPGAPGPYRVQRDASLPQHISQQLDSHAESIRESTGAYPPGDPPIVGGLTGGAGTRNGNGALANFASLLNHGWDELGDIPITSDRLRQIWEANQAEGSLPYEVGYRPKPNAKDRRGPYQPYTPPDPYLNDIGPVASAMGVPEDLADAFKRDSTPDMKWQYEMSMDVANKRLMEKGGLVDLEALTKANKELQGHTLNYYNKMEPGELWRRLRVVEAAIADQEVMLSKGVKPGPEINLNASNMFNERVKEMILDSLRAQGEFGPVSSPMAFDSVDVARASWLQTPVGRRYQQLHDIGSSVLRSPLENKEYNKLKQEYLRQGQTKATLAQWRHQDKLDTIEQAKMDAEDEMPYSEMRHTISPPQPGFDIRDLPPGTAPVADITRVSRSGKTRTTRPEVITDRNIKGAPAGVLAATGRQLRNVSSLLLDSWHGAQNVYNNGLQLSAREFNQKLYGYKVGNVWLGGDPAARAIMERMSDGANQLVMNYTNVFDPTTMASRPGTLSDIPMAVRKAAETDLPGISTMAPTTELKALFPAAIHPYIDEMSTWSKDVEARDANHFGSRFRSLDEDFNYWPGVFKHDGRGPGGARSQPGSSQPFERARSRVYEDPATGELRRPATDAERAASRPQSNAEAVYIFGQKLATTSWADQMASRDMAGYRRVQNDILLQRFRNTGLANRINGFNGQRPTPPKGWSIPDVEGFSARNVPHPDFMPSPADLADPVAMAASVRKFNDARVPTSFAYAVPDTLSVQLENTFGTRYGGVRPATLPAIGLLFKGVRQLTLLGFIGSPFQHVDITLRGLGNLTGDRLFNWHDPQDLAVGLARYPYDALTLVGGNVRAMVDPTFRRKLQAEFSGDMVGADPRMKAIALAGGNPLAVQGLVSGNLSRLTDELTRFPIFGGAADLPIGPLRVVPNTLNTYSEFMSKGLFEGVYVNTYKRMALDIWDSLKSRNPSWTDSKLAQVTAETTNLQLGSVSTWRAVIQNEGFRDMLRLFLVSFGDPESVIRGDLRAARGLANAVPGINIKSGSAEGKAAGREWVSSRVGYYANAFILANVINYAVTGNFLNPYQLSPVVWDDNEGRPKFNTHFFRPVMGFTDTGAPIFLDLLGQMDTGLRLIQPDAFAKNRLSSSMRFGLGWLTNSTYDGLKAGTSNDYWTRQWQKAKNLGFEALNPIGSKNLSEGVAIAGGNPVVLAGEGLGLNIYAGGLRDVQRSEAEARFVKGDIVDGVQTYRLRGPGDAAFKPEYGLGDIVNRNRGSIYDELSTGQKALIDALPNVQAERQKSKDYFTARGDTFSSTIDSLKADRDAYLADAESKYKSGVYLQPGNQEASLPSKFKHNAEVAMAQQDAINTAFAKTIEGFDVNAAKDNQNKYFAILVGTNGSDLPENSSGAIDWPETIARREAFLNTLPALERRDMNESLDLIESRRSPMQQEFRRDMNMLRDSKYPFGTSAATKFQEANPNADLAMWKWYGGALNTNEAVDKALQMQGQYPQPVKRAGYAHRIDTDLPAWRVAAPLVDFYETLSTTAKRNSALEASPALNAALVYWGKDVSFHTPQSLSVFDSMMQREAWPAWQDERIRTPLMIYLRQTDKVRGELITTPLMDAVVNMFKQYQYNRAPSFQSVAAKRVFTQLNPGVDVSRFPPIE